MYRLRKKTNQRVVSKKEVNENGIGSNYYTANPEPISFFNDDRIDVEIYPTAWGQFGVQVTCPDLDYDSDLRQFANEEEANLFARNQYTSLIKKLDLNEELTRRVIKRILEDVIRY